MAFHNQDNYVLQVKHSTLPIAGPIISRKSYTGEGSASFEKLEKPIWRPKGRQLNKFRSNIFTIMKTN